MVRTYQSSEVVELVGERLGLAGNLGKELSSSVMETGKGEEMGEGDLLWYM